MASWLGKYIEAEVDEKAEAFLVSAGYPAEVAKQLGPVISEITFEKDGDEFVQTIETPSAGRKNQLRFRLDESREMTGKNGVVIQSRFTWNEETRTLHSTFKSTDGNEFEIDFVFDPDYKTATKYRRTATVEAIQKIRRIG